MSNIDAAALAQARERLHYAAESALDEERTYSRARASDLRIVLDALREAERPRHELNITRSMRHGWPICGKCGVVIHEGENYCTEELPRIEVRDSAKEQS